jgi:hypothetical protein
MTRASAVVFYGCDRQGQRSRRLSDCLLAQALQEKQQRVSPGPPARYVLGEISFEAALAALAKESEVTASRSNWSGMRRKRKARAAQEPS